MDTVFVCGSGDVEQRVENILRRRLGKIVVRSKIKLPAWQVRVVFQGHPFNGTKEVAQFIRHIAKMYPIIS